MKYFKNRVDAGKQLASALKPVSKDAIVLAIPRGGMVVGFEVAKALGVQLDVVITRKIGAPDNPEFAIGAVAEDGTAILDDSIVGMLQVSKGYISEAVERQKLEIKRRLLRYRGDVPYPSLKNREVIVVDDGVATGSTLKAAIMSIRKKGARTIIVAVPVGPPDTVQQFSRLADRVVCLRMPEPFYAIGEFYDDFEQTEDVEVIKLLKMNKKRLQSKEDTQ
jgi:putative phosphoribosyl transferase